MRIRPRLGWGELVVLGEKVLFAFPMPVPASWLPAAGGGSLADCRLGADAVVPQSSGFRQDSGDRDTDDCAVPAAPLADSANFS